MAPCPGTADPALPLELKSTYVEEYTRLLGEGKREGSQWVFYCPFPECEGYRRPKFYVNPDNGAWQCLLPNTLVEMRDGTYIPIERVTVGDVTSRGVVTATMRQKTEKEIVCIKPYNLPRIYLTYDHPVKVADGSFIPASELGREHEVVVPFSTESAELSLTELELKVIGLWVAEGHYQRNHPGGGHYKCGFTIHPDEEEEAELIKEWASSLTNLYGREVTVTDRTKTDPRNGNTYRVLMVNSRVAANFMCKWVIGGRAREKRLTPSLMTAPTNQQGSLLIGLKAGDGYSCKARTSTVNGYTSASKALAMQVQRLLWRQGIVAGLWQGKQAGGFGPNNDGKVYRVMWYNGKSVRSRIENGVFRSKIYTVERHIPYEGEVYDLSIPETEEIPTEGGIVHNCKHCCKEVPGKVYRPDVRDPHGGTWREFVALMGDEDNLHRWPIYEGPRTPRTPPLPEREVRQIWTSLFQLFTLTEKDRELILSRGIDPDAAGLVSVTHQDWQELKASYPPDLLIRAGLARISNYNRELFPTRCSHPGRILVPFPCERGVRYFTGYQKCPERLPNQSETEYENFRQEWVKLALPTGYPSQIYGDLEPDLEYVLVTEGQLKALAAIQRGIPCLGLPGMGSGHLDATRLCKKFRVKRALIVFDTQKGEPGEPVDPQTVIDYEADRLAWQLLHQGIPAYRVRLPLDPYTYKQDIDSYLLNHSTGDFMAQLKEALPYQIQEDTHVPTT